MFKHHGRPPTGKLNFWFLAYAIFSSLELLLTFIMLMHINNYSSNISGFGVPFLFILPGLTVIAPIWGLFAVICGSADMMKTYSNMNATMILLNYPLTLLVLWSQQQPPVLTVIVLLLVFNKVTLSFFGAKVRQHFSNPCFAKN